MLAGRVIRSSGRYAIHKVNQRRKKVKEAGRLERLVGTKAGKIALPAAIGATALMWIMNREYRNYEQAGHDVASMKHRSQVASETEAVRRAAQLRDIRDGTTARLRMVLAEKGIKPPPGRVSRAAEAAYLTEAAAREPGGEPLFSKKEL